ncbi:MAG: putative GTP-binding protein [Candidatus Parcubacteria bacterium]|jgi:GTP-binding protein
MDIKSATFVRSVTNDENLIHDDIPQIAFVGRSNVGKSSVINSLVGRKSLVRSSSTPGFTKEANFFLVNEHTYIVDLPGYGFAKGSKADREKIMSLIQWYVFHPEIQQEKIVIILNAKTGPSYDDLSTIKELEQNKKDIVVVVNKIDKISQGELHKMLKTIENLIGPHLTIPYSAEKKIGVEKLRNVLFR